MRARGLALAAALVGCAHVPPEPLQLAGRNALRTPNPVPCISMCGLETWDFDCGELQDVENRALDAYAHHVKGWDRIRTCKALKGWNIRVHDFYTEADQVCGPHVWVQTIRIAKKKGGKKVPYDACVSGMTHVESRTIEIGDADLHSGALVHELAHALEWDLMEKADHCGWLLRGVRDAILEATDIPETNAKEVERWDDCSDSK